MVLPGRSGTTVVIQNELRLAVTNSLAVACKKSRIWTAGVSSVLWSAGALFAISFALIVSGTVVVLMMCLLRLADLSEKWDGDAMGQLLLLRGQMAQTMNREFGQDSDAELLRLSDEHLHDLNRNAIRARLTTPHTTSSAIPTNSATGSHEPTTLMTDCAPSRPLEYCGCRGALNDRSCTDIEEVRFLERPEFAADHRLNTISD
jgi:hypothetical protein